jgi:hypothetical protein
MYDRPPLYIRYRSSQHFLRDRSHIPLPEEQKLENVPNRVSLRPFAIGMRNLTCRLLEMDQHRGKRVRNYRTRRFQNYMPPYAFRSNPQALGKL